MDDEFDDSLILLSDGEDQNHGISNSDGPGKDHLRVLKERFGHSSFRPMQWKIIKSVMEDRRDNCVIMATGYGKSLCYQFPPVYKNGLSIVISPLISLMEDQVKSLDVAGIPSCLLGTAQTKKKHVMEQLFEGIYKVLYITPEFASGEEAQDMLPRLRKVVNIILIAIDEAHCVSQWGHDFRPAYKKLGLIRGILPSIPILTVTATATAIVKTNIIEILGLKNPQVLSTGLDRPNLYYKVERKNNPYQDLAEILFKQDKIYNIENGSVIIYCLTKKQTEEIVSLLKFHNIDAEPYHAGLSMGKRKEVHNLFVKDEIRIIVATVAFGMGIDKPNVRCVIHYGAAADIESYYQEAGRAGRDGNPSLCVIYYSGADFVTHGILRDQMQSSKAKENKMALNLKMQAFISSRDCRRDKLISYFDESHKPQKSVRLKCCDNCTKKLTAPVEHTQYTGLDSNGLYDFSQDAELFLKAMKAFLPASFGITKIILFLRGSKAKTLDARYMNKPNFGAGKDTSEAWWKELGPLLEQEKFIQKSMVTFGKSSFPVFKLTDKGEKWLERKERNSDLQLLLAPTDIMLKSLKRSKTVPELQNQWISSGSSGQQIQGPSMSNEPRPLNENEEKLLKELFGLRYRLAKSLDAMPHTIASDIALNQLALTKPRSIRQLQASKIDGFSEVKIQKFGSEWINKISEFCDNHPLPANTIAHILSLHPIVDKPLSATQMITVESFVQNQKLEEIAKRRLLVLSTITAHLAMALKTGFDLDMTRLIAPSVLYKIVKVIQEPPINYDTSTISAIKTACPSNFTYDSIKIAIAYLEVRRHIESLCLDYEDSYKLNKKDSLVAYIKSIVRYPDGYLTNLNKETPPSKSQPNAAFTNTAQNSAFKPNELDAGNSESPKLRNLGSYSATLNEEKMPSVNQPNADFTNTAQKLQKFTFKSKKLDPGRSESPKWEDDEMFLDNLNELDELDKSLQSEDPLKSENKFDKSLQSEDPPQAEDKFAKSLQSEDPPKSENKFDKSLQSEDPPKSENKAEEQSKESVSNASDKKELKRKLPDWMANTNAAKNAMKKKIAKSNLFN